MSKNKSTVPDAWDDDDWETQADVMNTTKEQRSHMLMQ
jgi:hypothetical protein